MAGLGAGSSSLLSSSDVGALCLLPGISRLNGLDTGLGGGGAGVVMGKRADATAARAGLLAWAAGAGVGWVGRGVVTVGGDTRGIGHV